MVDGLGGAGVWATVRTPEHRPLAPGFSVVGRGPLARLAPPLLLWGFPSSLLRTGRTSWPVGGRGREGGEHCLRHLLLGFSRVRGVLQEAHSVAEEVG